MQAITSYGKGGVSPFHSFGGDDELGKRRTDAPADHDAGDPDRRRRDLKHKGAYRFSADRKGETSQQTGWSQTKRPQNENDDSHRHVHVVERRNDPSPLLGVQVQHLLERMSRLRVHCARVRNVCRVRQMSATKGRCRNMQIRGGRLTVQVKSHHHVRNTDDGHDPDVDTAQELLAVHGGETFIER